MIGARLQTRDSRPFLARSFAGLYGIGALLIALTLALPHPQHRLTALQLTAAAVAAAVAGGLALRGARLPLRVFYALPPFGSVLVACVSLGAGGGNRPAYAAFFFWSIASAFLFFPRSIAAPNVPLAAALYAVVIWTGHEPFGTLRYFVPMAALAVSGVLIDRLNAERGRLQSDLEEVITSLDLQARTDPLTSLPNRREFEAQLGRELTRARRYGMPVSVLMIDLDSFKAYNDTHGHPAGDQMLRRTAEAWRGRLRAGDVLARYGGDEFAAILPDCRLENAWELSERLRDAVPWQRTCSIGAAMWTSDESEADFIRRADEALLSAKRGGRNQSQLAGAAA